MKGFWSNVNFIRLLTQTDLTEIKKDSIEENKSEENDKFDDNYNIENA